MSSTGFQAVFLITILPAILGSDSSPVPLPYAAVSYDAASVDASPAKTYVQPYNQDGFNVQTGYEGYLVPTIPGYDEIDVKKPLLAEVFSKKTGLFALLKPALESAIKFLPKIILVVFSVATLLLIGTALTTIVCSFTPICHLTFYKWPLTEEDVRGFLSHDKISEISSFVKSAIKKYKGLNKKSPKENSEEGREAKVVSIDSNNVK